MRETAPKQFISELPKAEVAQPNAKSEERMGHVIPFPISDRIARSPEKRNAANHIIAALQEIENQKGKPGIEAVLA